MKRNLTLWITFVFVLVKYLPSAESFQCFECENCPTIGEDARDYIKECSSTLVETPLFVTQEPFEYVTILSVEGSTENESILISSSEAYQSSTSSSTSIGLGMNSTNFANSTNSANSKNSSSSLGSTLSSQASLNQTGTTQKLLNGSSQAPNTTTTTKPSTESTTAKQKVTSSWSIFPNSVEESELSNNLQPESPGDQLFGWNARRANDLCYVLKLKYDGQEITKRGCGLRDQDGDQTCQILAKGEPNAECRVCEGNLCNSGSNLRSAVTGFLLVLIVLRAYIY